MNETAPLTDNITKISVDSKRDEFVEQLRDCSFDADRTYGFMIEKEGSESLSATLTSTSPTRIQTFDEEQGRLVTEDVIQTETTDFRVDFEREFLEVFANKEQNGEVINRLGQTTPGLTVYDRSFNLAKLHNLLHESNLSISVNAVRINNFSLTENTNGNCYLNTYDDQTAKDIIHEYESDITHLSAVFTIDGEDVTVGFYRSGSVRIYSKTDKQGKLLEATKDLLTELERSD